MISWATCAPTQLSILQSFGLGCCHVGGKPLQLHLPGDTDHLWSCITSLLPLGVARPGHHRHLAPGNPLWGCPVHVGCLAASLALSTGPQEQLPSCLVITKQVSRRCQMSSQGSRAIPPGAGSKYSRPPAVQCSLCLWWKRQKGYLCVCFREGPSVLNNSIGAVRGHDFMDIPGPRERENTLEGWQNPYPQCCIKDVISRLSWPAPSTIPGTGKPMS